jgi:gas vesicle protein
MSKDDCCSGSLGTFLTGALFGVAVGLLLAPRTGKETREVLSDYGASIKESLPEDLREKTEETIEKGLEYIDDKKQALNDAIDAGRVAMEEEKESLSAALGKDKA